MTPTPKARIDTDSGPYRLTTHTVWITWPDAGVDRPDTHGISTGTDRRLAERLAAAIDAGAATRNPTIRTDINGRTYIQADTLVIGKYLNSDLKRLGY